MTHWQEEIPINLLSIQKLLNKPNFEKDVLYTKINNHEKALLHYLDSVDKNQKELGRIINIESELRAYDLRSIPAGQIMIDLGYIAKDNPKFKGYSSQWEKLLTKDQKVRF